MKPVSLRSRSRGVSLIEVMISLVIGLVVVGAVIVSMIGSGNAGRFQAAYGQMNDDAQLGLSILSREIQMAGYSLPTGVVNTAGAGTPTFDFSFTSMGTSTFVFGCDNGFASATAATVACGTATTPAFEVVYEADSATTAPAAGTPSDCVGSAIAGPAPYVARNRFFISTGPSGRPELYCASDKVGGSSQQIVENIETMRVWYGVQVAAAPRQVVRYVSAADINAVVPPDWNNVISVRICLLVRSAEPVLTTGGEDTLTYQDCGSAAQTSADRRLRRAYFTTSTVCKNMAF